MHRETGPDEHQPSRAEMFGRLGLPALAAGAALVVVPVIVVLAFTRSTSQADVTTTTSANQVHQTG
jgi:hypothetical protein